MTKRGTSVNLQLDKTNNLTNMNDTFWIAKDDNGDIFAYENMPVKDGTVYVVDDSRDRYCYINGNMESFISHLEIGSEPIEVTIKKV